MHEKAIKLYDKCGFKIVMTLREEVYKNGNFEDMYIMSILKREYKC
jgi:RimJ/RimL family protein N-acetyltransferase